MKQQKTTRKQSKTQSATTTASGLQKVGKSPAKTGRSNARYPTLNAQGQLRKTLTEVQQASLEYLAGLTDPHIPTKVPVLLGQFELFTDTYTVELAGTAVASSAGVAFVQVVPDLWGEIPYKLAAYTTGGNAVWSSIAGGASSSTVPVGGSTSANAGATALPKLDPGWEAATEARMVAAILEVWPESSAQTSTGTITVASVQSAEGLGDAVLSGVSYNGIVSLQQPFVEHQEFPIPGWTSGQVAHANAVPFDESCFIMAQIPSAGTTTCGSCILAAVGAGMQAGQILRWRVTYKYECTMPQTYQSNLIREPTIEVPRGQMVEGLGHLKEMGSTLGPPARNRMKGLAAAMKTEAGGLGSAVRDVAKAVVNGDNLGSALRHGAKSVVGGLLSQVPLVGQFLKMGSDWLFG